MFRFAGQIIHSCDGDGRIGTIATIEAGGTLHWGTKSADRPDKSERCPGCLIELPKYVTTLRVDEEVRSR